MAMKSGAHRHPLEQGHPEKNTNFYFIKHKSSHVYICLYSALNNTNCTKQLHNIKIGK